MKYDVSDFQSQVIERSFTVPVLVDFWAEWCGPCRILGPTLERLADGANGDWELAKVDTERMPDVAARYGIQSIPNVKLFVDGKPANEFVGALPEPQIRAWLSKALPSRNRQLVEHAEVLLAQGSTAEATAILKDVVAKEPANGHAHALLARTLVFTDPAAALVHADGVNDPQFYEIAEAVRTMAHLGEMMKDGADLPDGDTTRLYREAIGLTLRGNFDAALEKFIEVIRLDRKLDDDGARKACIAIFKFLAEEHEVTRSWRREFSSALY